MDSVGYLQLLRRRWVTLVLTTVIVALAATAYSYTIAPQYRAGAQLFYSVTASGSATDLVQGSTYTQQVVQSYTDVARSPLVLEPVIEQLDLDTTPGQLATRIDAVAGVDSVIITLTARAASPDEAARIANAVADQLRVTSENLSPRSARDRASIDVTVITPATVPGYPFAPAKRLYLAVGLVLGVLLGLGLAVLKERLSHRVRGDAEVALLTEAPVLAHIPFDRSRHVEPALLRAGANPARVEAIRRLRINLESIGLGPRPSVLLVTSALPGEGKTTTVVDLALALSEAGYSVLLVDADLRRPRVASYLGLEQSVGLTDVLRSEISVDRAAQPWRRENLHVLVSGDIPPNQSRLLGSPQMSALVELTRGLYDVVLIDGAPLLPVADSVELSKIVDATMLVVRSRKVRVDDLGRALGTLTKAGTDLVGVVVNRSKQSRHMQYHYGYGAPGPLRRAVRRWILGESRRERAYAELRAAEFETEPAPAPPSRRH